MLPTILQTLINFANNPDASWGKPTDGGGNPTDITSGKEVRVPAEQSDRNTARLNSGTYTKDQYDAFN